MGKVIYLDYYRWQERDISPHIGCVSLTRPYVVDASVPPKSRPAIARRETSPMLTSDSQGTANVTRLPL